MIRLYSYFRSSASYRVRIALELKGLPYEQIPVNLRSDEHLSAAFGQANPEQAVPVLEDGALRLSQSLAILEYLEERYPSPALLPAEPAARAQARSLAQLIACDIHPLNNLRVLRYLIGPMEVSSEHKDAWYQHWIALGFAALERHLSGNPKQLFCVGDTPGYADCVLVPQVFNAQRMHCDLSAMPRIREIADRCNSLPAFQRAHPSQCPDAIDA